MLLWRAPDRPGPVASEVEPPQPPLSYDAPPHSRPAPSAGRWAGPEPLWRVVDDGGTSAQFTPPYSQSWSKAGRALVDVTAAASGANAWQVGDRLAVELPQLGGVHEWTIERIVDGTDARSRSARGWLYSGEDSPRRIVVTVGPGRVLAYIDTPQGPYELTGNARLAWLLPSSNMMAGIDFTKSDYIPADRPERTPPPGPEGRP